MTTTYVGDQPVRIWAEDTVEATELSEENVLAHLDIGAVGNDGRVVVTAVAEICWSEFDLAVCWPEATGQHVRAVRRMFREMHGADDVQYGDDTDEGFMSIEWTVEVDASITLADALEQIYARKPEGPVGLHNALNGGYLSRNTYADVRRAVAEVGS